MIKFALPVFLLMTYSEWFLRTYEMQSVYPFNGTRVLPEDAGEGRLREVSMLTPDDEILILWVAPPTADRATILYFPGNAGNLATRAGRFTEFLNNGYGLVALAYRGSSGSSGSPTEETLSADALLVFDAVLRLVGISDGPVILYGESLGTSIAAKVALVREADAIVMEAPFTSIPDLAATQYPDIDLSGILTQFWDTAAVIGGVEEPLLILHGADDKLVPVEQGQTVFRLAGSADKQIEILKGVGHQGVWTEIAMKALYAFMDRL